MPGDLTNMDQPTSSALLEQLVYIDNFVNPNSTNEELTPNLDIDGQLSLDLAAFADDSFIFPDENKKPNDKDYDSSDEKKDHDSPQTNELGGIFNNVSLDKLPKFPVPPGAKSSLESVGLSTNQIDLLSALIAQHQSSLGNFVPNNKLPTLPTQSDQRPGHVRQHSYIPGIETDFSFNNNNNNSLSSASSSTTVTPSSIQTPKTTANSSPSGVTDLEKRRRNTAASARFRIKKKLKEKQMESKILGLQELIKLLENKIQSLEMENKLLKNLIIEKGSQKSDDELRLLKERAKLN